MTAPGIARSRVMVGFAEAASAPEVVWSLVDAGFEVLAFAREGRASALRHSRHVVCHDIRSPESDACGALADLSSLTASVGSPILFPLDDASVWLISRIAPSGSGAIVGPVGDTADLALDKRLQLQAATRAGFNVPSTRVALTADELRSMGGEYPLILKPAQCAVLERGRLRRSRSWIVDNQQELERAAHEWDERAPLLVQPFIDGIGEGVFGLATPSGVRAWSSHRRLRMMNPHGSGSSACVSQSLSADVKAAAEIFIEQTRWRGLFMIELLRDASGRPWFVELNGRPWGSMALARRQGFEYPAWQVRLALDPHSSAERVDGVAGLVCRHVGRELMHLLFVLRGPRSRALRQWPSVLTTMGGVVSIRRRDALYNWRRDDPMVFITDCYQTVHDNLLKRGR